MGKIIIKNYESVIISLTYLQPEQTSLSILAPQWWNGVTSTLRIAQSLFILHCKMKTRLFKVHLGSSNAEI